MEYHLDRALKLKTEPKHKSLYKWAIVEIVENDQNKQRDQIPWPWTSYFTAKNCLVHDSLSIDAEKTAVDGNSSPQYSENQQITIFLKPGYIGRDGFYSNQTRFSMFGTSRTINDIWLNIYPILEPGRQESCSAWGSVSNTCEIDFINETTNDVLIFNLFVKPASFSRYAQAIRAGYADEIGFSVGRVSGFYSDWSPSVSTDSIKILAAGAEQHIDTIADPEIDLPRLGIVGKCSLYINRRRVFDEPEAVPKGLEYASDDGMAPAQPSLPQEALTDSHTLRLLRSQIKATWWVVALLVAIALNSLFR